MPQTNNFSNKNSNQNPANSNSGSKVGYYNPQNLPEYPIQNPSQNQSNNVNSPIQNISSIPQTFDPDKAVMEEKKLEEDLGLRLPPDILSWRNMGKAQKQAFKSQNPQKANQMQNVTIMWLDLFDLIKEAYFWGVIQKKDINNILASFWNFSLNNKIWYLEFLKDLIENKQYGEAILENYYIQKYQEDYLNDILKDIPEEVHVIFRELYYTYILGEEPDPDTIDAANQIKKILTEYNESEQLGKDAFDQIQNYKKSPLNLSSKTTVNTTQPISREEILKALSDNQNKE